MEVGRKVGGAGLETRKERLLSQLAVRNRRKFVSHVRLTVFEETRKYYADFPTQNSGPSPSTVPDHQKVAAVPPEDAKQKQTSRYRFSPNFSKMTKLRRRSRVL